MSNPAHMWRHWRDKYGFEEAIREYYPELLASNPSIQAALIMIEMGKETINREFALLANGEADDLAD